MKASVDFFEKLDKLGRRKYYRKATKYNFRGLPVTTNEQIRTYNLSLKYLNGENVPQDLEKSFALNAEVARHGYRQAVLAMGWYYLGGVGVGQDFEKAKSWYRKSARHGEPMAMFSLGRIALEERSFTESFKWFSRAADTGHARSLYWLGKHYWFGNGVNRNKQEAMRLFHLAAGKKVKAARRVVKYLSRKRA
jgi:hypothetical protein